MPQPNVNDSSEILQHLEAIRMLRHRMTHGQAPDGFVYTSVEDWLLKHGRPMEPVTEWSAAEEIRLRRLRQQIRPQLKGCFANCQRAILHRLDPGLVYCEGYVSAVIPIYHAWLLFDGKLWDPTRELWGHDLPVEYFGAAFPDEMVRTTLLTTERYGSLLDDWEQRWPLLRRPWEDGQCPGLDRP